ncbi:MAG: hypothetical protein NC182_00065 [Prevotella sp.]|nr:hypothetical protein [Staphylococcus sp.]MCM1349579.1 hypothetical protein [Prevotella sp.]
MKKIISLLCVLCCLFLVSCKRQIKEDKLENSRKENIEEIQYNSLKEKLLENDFDEEKRKILTILYLGTNEEIIEYLKPSVLQEEAKDLMELSKKPSKLTDEAKKALIEIYLGEYFVKDIDARKNFEALSLDYQYAIYREMVYGNDWDKKEIMNILHNGSYRINEIFAELVLKESLEEFEYRAPLKIAKEAIVTPFLNFFFKENTKILNKCKELPLDYQYIIYQKLK